MSIKHQSRSIIRKFQSIRIRRYAHNTHTQKNRAQQHPHRQTREYVCLYVCAGTQAASSALCVRVYDVLAVSLTSTCRRSWTKLPSVHICRESHTATRAKTRAYKHTRTSAHLAGRQDQPTPVDGYLMYTTRNISRRRSFRCRTHCSCRAQLCVCVEYSLEIGP